jgi:hypothetical protein
VLAAPAGAKPGDVTLRDQLHACRRQRAMALSKAGRHAEALDEWNRLVAPGDGPTLTRACRALALARVGAAVKALAEVDSIEHTPDLDAATCRELARVLATLAGPSSHSELADRAVAWVRRSLAVADQGLDDLVPDPDLDSLRSRTDFGLLAMDEVMPLDTFAP